MESTQFWAKFDQKPSDIAWTIQKSNIFFQRIVVGTHLNLSGLFLCNSLDLPHLLGMKFECQFRNPLLDISRPSRNVDRDGDSLLIQTPQNSKVLSISERTKGQKFAKKSQIHAMRQTLLCHNFWILQGLNELSGQHSPRWFFSKNSLDSTQNFIKRRNLEKLQKLYWQC